MSVRIRAVAAATALATACALLPPSFSQEEAPPTPEELAARERVRPKIEAIWADVRTPPTLGTEPDPYYFFTVSDALVALGPDAIPFLSAEVDLVDPQTFHFAAYALGRLGGPAAEAALRKAERRGDERGGRFGIACKRFATFGLALMGFPDALDMIQENNAIAAYQIIPDMALMTHYASLVGPRGVPVLVKQIEEYAKDPETAEKLEWSIRGLGAARDPAAVPKLVPFLKSPSAKVRDATIEAIGLLGSPADCEKLLPFLANAKTFENRTAASALSRLEPAACAAAITSHLAVERDVEVRAELYRALAKVRGEAALEVFRQYIGTNDPYDATVLLDAIGRVGSRKGLNLVRAYLKNPNQNGLQRAVETLEALGGEGAIDTLLALTSDPRPTVRLLAIRSLTRMRVARSAPRIAGVLLETVREPVANLALRAPIAEFTDDLVELKFTDAADDVEAAGKLQSDAPIAASLASCAGRLKLLVANGDDVAKWTLAAADPDAAVRRLAVTRLAELGAADALGARWAAPGLSADDRTALVLAVGRTKLGAAAGLVEKALSDPGLDVPAYRETRDAAAWAAREVGGERGLRALEDSARRRDGRDFSTLVYWALADPAHAKEAIPALKVLRLRYPESTFGREDLLIDELEREIAHGRPPRRFDVTPERLGDL